MERKEVLVVDLNDNPIKKVEKLSAHKKPILHRAFSVFLIDGSKILIQKRAKTKYHSPSLWANACCSHPLTADISFEANLRLKEELGISKTIPLEELFSFVYFANLGAIFEYELDHVLLGNYSGKISINPEEAEKFEWIEISKLEKQLETNPKKFAPWFLICAPKVIEIIKNRQI